MARERWGSGDAYEAYVGRWSRSVAREFVTWLDAPPDGAWLDVGCGTGALSQIVLELAEPASITGVDPSPDHVRLATEQVTDERATFEVGDANGLPDREGYDLVVSGLVLNFVPDQRAALAEMVRVSRRGGIIAAYVWDYAEGMQMMRHFWDAAIEQDPAAAHHDEAPRFEICRPDALVALWEGSGLGSVETRAVEVDTVFSDFDDYWTPFLSPHAPAPAYNMCLEPEARERLKEALREGLPIAADGTIPLTARAWAVMGRV